MNDSIKRRRRGAVLEAAVLDAAWEEIAEHGYETFTVDGVAARAGTSKTVLYRRWPSRADLAKAAIVRFLQQHPPHVPDTGSLREDVLAYLRETGKNREGSEIWLFAILAEFEKGTGTTFDELVQSVVPDHESVMSQIIRRAVDRGEVDPDRLSERIIRLPADLLRLEGIMAARPLSAESAEEVVDTMFLPLVRSCPEP